MDSVVYSSDDDSFEDFCKKKNDFVAMEQIDTPRIEQVFDIQMDRWLNFISPLSFGTKMFDLEKNVAQAILKKIRTYQIIGGQMRDNPDAEKLSTEEENLLKNLEHVLDRHLGGNIHFVKLSTRSYKDSVFEMKSQRTAEFVEKELEKINWKDVKDERELDNLEVQAFFRGANRAMSVKSGREVLELSFQSFRVRQDLEAALKREPWDLKVVVREYVEIPLEGEFRGFVFEKRLVALSQYFWFAKFDKLILEKEATKLKLEKFFYEECAERIPYDNFVIDFAIAQEKIYVVELNPFGNVSGACLLDWNKDKDLLYGKKENCVLEVRNSYMVDMRKRALVDYWDKWLQERREREKERKNCVVC